MKNFKFEILDEQLLITINLNEAHGLSKTGRNVVIASSGGNVRLFDENGFRDEKINFSVTKEAGPDDMANMT